MSIIKINKINETRAINEEVNVVGVKSCRFKLHSTGNFKTLSKIKVKLILGFPTNIIAEVDLRDNYDLRIIYAENKTNDRVIVYTKNSDHIVSIFKRQDNNLYCLERKNSHRETIFSIREILNCQKLNNSQIDRMYRVHEMHKRMGYLSLENLHEMLKNNTISGKFSEGEIGPKDVNSYRTHLHSKICNGCNLAKMDSQPASPIDRAEIPDKPGTLHADVMFITHDRGKLTFMVGIDEQSAMTFSVMMKSTDVGEMISAIDLIKNCYARFNHKVDVIHFDGDKGVDNEGFKAHNYSQNTDVDCHTPGRHARRAEAAIKLIKRTFKAVIVGLDYPCPIALYPYAIRWCTQCINLASKTGNKVISPWTIFTDRKVQFENHFNAKFGDIVTTRARAADNDRPKSNKPITTFGIILCRDEGLKGIYLIMDLESKKVIKRRQFKLYKGERNNVILDRIKSLGYASANTSFGHVAENIISVSEMDENENEGA